MTLASPRTIPTIVIVRAKTSNPLFRGPPLVSEPVVFEPVDDHVGGDLEAHGDGLGLDKREGVSFFGHKEFREGINTFVLRQNFLFHALSTSMRGWNQPGVDRGKLTTLYITKWVLARGIIVAEGEPHKITPRQHRNLYEVYIPGHRWGVVLLTVGSEAFLTLEEAKVQASKMFQRHFEDCEAALEAAKEAVKLFQEGKLEVHKNPIRIKDVHAFGRALLPRVDSEPLVS